MTFAILIDFDNFRFGITLGPSVLRVQIGFFVLLFTSINVELEAYRHFEISNASQETINTLIDEINYLKSKDDIKDY